MTTYLVTGATGLIGRHYVQLILTDPDTEKVWVTVRAGSQNKLARIAGNWPNAHKLEPVVGDLSEELFGIGEDTRASLLGKVDHVVHLAALYDITADDETSIRANVGGTANVIDLCEAIAARCLHHVSSVAVAGDFAGTFTEEMFDVGQRLPTAYHRTKFESERLVREQATVPWRVYRPAIVVGNSKTGEMDKIDGPYYLFPTISRLSALPSLPVIAPDIGDTNVVPVDYVAEALRVLVREEGLDQRTFHLVNPKPQPVSSVYNAFARAAGAPTITAEFPERVSRGIVGMLKLSEHIPGVTVARDAVMERLGMPPVLLENLSFPSVFTSAATQEVLARHGVKVPRLEGYAEILWAYWAEHLDPFRKPAVSTGDRRTTPRPLQG